MDKIAKYVSKQKSFTYNNILDSLILITQLSVKLDPKSTRKKSIVWVH